MAVRDLQDGATIAISLLVREADLRRKRDGSEYLRLVLADRTGTLPAVLWDGAAEASSTCRVGEPVRVAGRYSVHPRFGAQLVVGALRTCSPGEVVVDDLVDGPTRS